MPDVRWKGQAMKPVLVQAPGLRGKVHILSSVDRRDTCCGVAWYPPDWRLIKPMEVLTAGSCCQRCEQAYTALKRRGRAAP